MRTYIVGITDFTNNNINIDTTALIYEKDDHKVVLIITRQDCLDIIESMNENNPDSVEITKQHICNARGGS